MHDPGILPGSADWCILGKVCLRSDLPSNSCSTEEEEADAPDTYLNKSLPFDPDLVATTRRQDTYCLRANSYIRTDRKLTDRLKSATRFHCVFARFTFKTSVRKSPAMLKGVCAEETMLEVEAKDLHQRNSLTQQVTYLFGLTGLFTHAATQYMT